MSMELLVILALERAPNAGEWQRSLDSKNAPIHLAENVDLAKHTGFVPVTLKGHQSGFYFRRESYVELSSHYRALQEANVDDPVVYAIGYGVDPLECATAFYAVSALASAFQGKAFEPQGGVFLEESELLAAADRCYSVAELRGEIGDRR